MLLYGITLLLLAAKLQQAVPECLQPWYADDLTFLGPASANAKCFQLLLKWGPTVGYFPSPEKFFHVCPQQDEPAAQQAFDETGLHVQYT